ncbi:MAG TPA: methionyl-tRNA formyltransferase [Thermoanaerobaculia bacterium]|jgi:methionyl-tRNA formyltransferase|nr:methionyl-tRNA formyltransferase [Thermoanaerobaculia bacterium]
MLSGHVFSPVLSFARRSAIDRIVFFGTPEFAVPTLAALVAAGRAPVRVVTQPARPAGRGQKPQEPPVARWAREHGLPVMQPERVRDPAFLEEIAALAPDVAVVVAFGQIFPRALLDLPRHGCVNLHASLLPRWRGAAPIQAAVAAGDARTGVSTMLMEAGLDTGPILLAEATEIGPRETAGELARRLAEAGGGLMVRTLQELERGTLAPRPQPPEGVTYAPRLTRDCGRIDWSLPALAIHHRLRAYTPWPGSTAELRGAPVKIVAAEVLDGDAGDAGPGTYLGLRQGLLAVACGGRTILGVAELQRPGKRALRAPDFANGERLQAGERFS